MLRSQPKVAGSGTVRSGPKRPAEIRPDTTLSCPGRLGGSSRLYSSCRSPYPGPSCREHLKRLDGSRRGCALEAELRATSGEAQLLGGRISSTDENPPTHGSGSCGTKAGASGSSLTNPPGGAVYAVLMVETAGGSPYASFRMPYWAPHRRRKAGSNQGADGQCSGPGKNGRA